MSPTAVDEAVWRFADALIWNWVIAGTDAHAKNYSLLLAGGEVRLAPLYDVASALPYGESEHALRFAMKLGRDYKVTTYANPWPGVARDLGLRERELVDRARDLSAAAADAFSAAAAAPDVAALGSGLPARMVDLVAGRATRCRRALDGA
jgi:serine/threonine-protein kinase HipA